MQEVEFIHLGLIPYQDAWNYQHTLFNRTVAQKLFNQNRPPEKHAHIPNYLLFCEHPPVITIGKSGKMHHLLMNEEWLKQRGIEFFRVNRGGDITYHGPGQIVGYPILDLDQFFTDIHRYLRLLEEMIILTLADFGLHGERMPKATGVWLDASNPVKARKICAMGIRTSRWVTMHGFALNVNTDLQPFGFIVPCGIPNKQVTSMQQELGVPVDISQVEKSLMRHFEALFQVKLKTNLHAARLIQ
ncbi:MAG: octanoyltransferase [Chitinophagales bacterium]|nr:MAG: octanoyltransferase [Chitinophagales bacterium]